MAELFLWAEKTEAAEEIPCMHRRRASSAVSLGYSASRGDTKKIAFDRYRLEVGVEVSRLKLEVVVVVDTKVSFEDKSEVCLPASGHVGEQVEAAPLCARLLCDAMPTGALRR